MHSEAKQVVSSKDEATLSTTEPSSEGGDKMTTTMKALAILAEPTMKALAIVQHNMTEKEFMEHWAKVYPQHCFGGYNEDQWVLWQANAFEFVAKWPVISHYLIEYYS